MDLETFFSTLVDDSSIPIILTKGTETINTSKEDWKADTNHSIEWKFAEIFGFTLFDYGLIVRLKN